MSCTVVFTTNEAIRLYGFGILFYDMVWQSPQNRLTFLPKYKQTGTSDLEISKILEIWISQGFEIWDDFVGTYGFAIRSAKKPKWSPHQIIPCQRWHKSQTKIRDGRINWKKLTSTIKSRYFWSRISFFFAIQKTLCFSSCQAFSWIFSVGA